MWDEKAILRAEKYIEALESENESIHFVLWRRELQEPFDDDGLEGLDDPGPPPGWTPELN